MLSGCHFNTAAHVLLCSEIRINQELDCEVSRLTFPHMSHILCTNIEIPVSGVFGEPDSRMKANCSALLFVSWKRDFSERGGMA